MSIKTNTASLQNLLDAVNNLPEAGTDLPELSNEGSASDMLSGKQLIDSGGNIVTGTIATKTSSNLTASGATVTVPAGYYASNASKSVTTATQATPSISIDSAGKITASATQSAGYVTAGTKSGTKQLTTQAAKTITPTKSSQTAVSSGVYTTGAVTVAAIPSQYVDNSSVTAVESDVMSGKKFGANGSVKTGTFSLDTELSTQDDLIAQLSAAVNSLPEAGGSGGEIKSFTCTVDVIPHIGNAINPFLEGMTWGEFISSPLNYKRNNGITSDVSYTIDGNYVQFLNSGGAWVYVSIDGTYGNRVLITDRIMEMEYSYYLDTQNGGSWE